MAVIAQPRRKLGDPQRTLRWQSKASLQSPSSLSVFASLQGYDSMLKPSEPTWRCRFCSLPFWHPLFIPGHHHGHEWLLGSGGQGKKLRSRKGKSRKGSRQEHGRQGWPVRQAVVKWGLGDSGIDGVARRAHEHTSTRAQTTRKIEERLPEARHLRGVVFLTLA